MQIAQNMVVSLIYTLQADNAEGEILQTATQENPLTFIYGHDQLLPAFEENILGLEPGSSYAFSLSYDDAYGPVDPDSIFDVDINIFRQSPEGEQMLFIDNVIPLMDQDGNRFEGRVMQIDENSVKMDFNHPLAGMRLYFTGSILEVRPATPEELAHGHVHGVGGHED